MIFRHLLNMRSHPTWVRELKHQITINPKTLSLSHPTWVRELKHFGLFSIKTRKKSHPTWVRELKLTMQHVA